MSASNIGVAVDDFRLATKEGLRKAADMRFRAVELATVAGEVAPENLSSSGRRHLARYVDGLGLRLAALIADTPRLRLTDAGTVDERVQRTREILSLAADLRVPIVTASIGELTHPETGEPSPLAIEALRAIGEAADMRGRIFAVRPSRDDASRVRKVLNELGCPSIRVGLDPAAVVMNGVNPLKAIEQIVEHVALVHMRDGTAGMPEQGGRETRLDEGDVDLPGLLAMLSAADYPGHYTVRRTDSATPIADIEHGRDVLTALLPPG